MSDFSSSFAVVGGDARLSACAGLLRESGSRVVLCCHGENNVSVPVGTDNYILPIPVSTDGKTVNAPLSAVKIPLSAVVDAACPGTRFFGGLIPGELWSGIKEKGGLVFDYSQNEDFQYANAVLTSEGAIASLIQASPKSVRGSRILIAGFGRIGRILAGQLTALGSSVSVFARKDTDLAYASALGYVPVRYRNLGGGFDAIFNTVPAQVFTSEVLMRFGSGCLYIELASAPHGAKEEDVCAAGHIYLLASGLPGRFSPLSAGIVIKETVCSLIRSEGI